MSDAVRPPPSVEPEPAFPLSRDLVAPMITHLVGQEAHAFNRQAVADRYRLLVTLTGGTAAFVVPATLLHDDGVYLVATTIMLFVVALGGFYRWQSAVWRLVVLQVQSQRLIALGQRQGTLDLADSDQLFAFFARATRRDVFGVDLLQMLAILVLLLVAAGPVTGEWIDRTCPPASAPLPCLVDHLWPNKSP